MDEWNNEAANAAYEAGLEAANEVVDKWRERAASFGDYEEVFWEGIYENL